MTQKRIPLSNNSLKRRNVLSNCYIANKLHLVFFYCSLFLENVRKITFISELPAFNTNLRVLRNSAHTQVI